MQEINIEYFTSNMRLCQMPVRMFDGYVRVKKSESLETDDGVIETTEYFRPVLAPETIKTANSFRSEIARAVNAIGFKAAPLGVLVDSRGLDALKILERDSRVRADEIRELMLEDLAKNGESDRLARCEVDLIALRLHPEEEFAEQVDRLISEALLEKFDAAASDLNRTLSESLASLAAGHALLAQRKLSIVGRFLVRLVEHQGETTELALFREDLKTAKQIIALPDLPVEKKLEQLKILTLFGGVKLSPHLQSGDESAAAKPRANRN